MLLRHQPSFANRRTNPGKSIWADQSGVTAVEFAFVAPVLMVLLMGLFDAGHQLYTASVLQGALHEAARDSTLETGFSMTTVIDEQVKDAVHTVAPTADITLTRSNYVDFSDVSQPEEFTDNDGDGICNNGEPFEDLNANGTWDADRGRDGLGGARDAVLYTATATYDRLFPMAGLIGLPEKISLQANTVLRNQPFDDQGTRQPVVENCP